MKKTISVLAIFFAVVTASAQTPWDVLQGGGFLKRDTTTGRYRIYVTETKDSLGIGTLTPITKLDINGNFRAVASSYVAVTGQSSSNTAVYGASTSGIGAYGASVSGSGVLGHSHTGYAGLFQGRLKADTFYVGVTNRIKIDTVNAVRLEGNATVWEDLMFPFQLGKSGVADYPPFVADSNYFTFTVDTTSGTKCIMYFTIQMPHRWKEGSIVYPHIHYKHETGVGTPKFIVKYKWINIGAAATPIAWGWYRMETTTGTTDKTQQLVSGSGGISGAGKTLSSLLLVQVYLRDNPANVNAYQFDVHYEIDALGSASETGK